MSKFKPVSISPIIPEKTFRAFVQTVLPTIYDDSLSYYELLNKAVKILNGNIENINILSENQSKFIEEVTNYINSLEISIVPYDIALNFDVDTFDEMKATIANGGICCIALLDTDGSKNYLYYSNDRYYSDSNQNRMTFNGLTNIKNADDYSGNNAPSIITLSLEKVNDAIVVSYSKKYKVATEHDIDTAFANAIAISVQTYAFSYNVNTDTLSVSDVTRDIVGAINNNRICVCKVVEENKPDVECYYSGRNSVNNAEKLVFVGNIIDNGVCVGTKTVNIDANADAFLVEGVTTVNDKRYADWNAINFIDFDARYDNNSLVLVNYQHPGEVYIYYRNNANKEFCVPRFRILNNEGYILQEYYCFHSNIQSPIVSNPNMNHMTFTFYLANDFSGYNAVEISGRYNSDSWLMTENTEYNTLLPRVTSADNSKSLVVKDGKWKAENVGKLNNVLSAMLIPILRNGLYGTDQTTAIDALESAIESGEITTYSITNNLTNVTNSNGANAVVSGAAYSATLTPASGMELSEVSVNMGGSDITSTAYSNGAINITSVTGNVVITAVAESIIETYTPTMIAGYYIVANGTEYDHTSYTRTPVIPCRAGDKVYGTCENSNYPGTVVNYIRAKWTAAYDNNGTAIESAGSNTQYDYSQSSPYIVPHGVYGVVFSMVNVLANDVVIYVDKSERAGA